jgi:hypothetical protein
MKKLLLFIVAIIVIADIAGQDATILKLPDGLSPVIDGSVDNLWNMSEEFNIDKPFMEEEPTLYKATWQAVWNDTALFVIVSVVEDNFCPHWCSGAADWESDKIEVYFDVNETLRDGGGPAGEPNGHYQCAPGFIEGEDQYYFSGPIWQTLEGSYAYKIDEPDYVFEYSIPWSSLTDENGIAFDPDIGRPIGFDVCVVDRDEGDFDRKRAVWMNDGKGPGSDESWNNMDDCGILAFEELQPNDSIVCGTRRRSFTSFNVPTDSVADYYWRNSNVGDRIDSSTNYVIIEWYTPGEKNISLIITKILGSIDTFEYKLTVYPDFSISLGEDFTICKNTDFTVIPTTVNGIRPFNYFWNPHSGDSVYTGSITESIYLGLKIEDDVGCTATDNIFINIPQSCFPEQICMVTVDAATGKNKIIWQKTGSVMIKEYKILKESTVAGQYSEIGTVPFNNESVFIDYDSDPAKHSDRYRLATIDSCANTPGQSSDHQTIHLMISRGLPGTYNLSWSVYTGFDYNTYYIYKGSSTDNLELIDSIARTKTQYTDTASGIAYYQVAVRRDQPCDISVLKSTGDLYCEATSNIVNTVATNINNNESFETYFELFPNPVSDELVIVYSLSKPSDVSIEIYNLLGMKIHEFHRYHNNSGIFRYIVTKDILLNTGNIKIVKLKLNGKVFYKKVIIN